LRKLTEFKKLINSNIFEDLFGDPKKADDVNEIITEYEYSHLNLCEPIEREAQFFGAKTVGGGKLNNYTRFVLIPAVREVLDEATEKKEASINYLIL